MDIALAVIFVITSAWLVQWLVRWFGGEGHTPLDFWTALGTLFLARLGVRALLWVVPGMDSPLRVSLSVGVYVAVMTGLLVLYAKVRPIRALGISVLIAVLMTARAILYLLGI